MSLESFFYPRSVAIVGASRQEGKVGYEILNNLVRDGFEGEVFPVNPKVDEILGIKSYPDLASIGKSPDLAIIILPAKIVPTIMEQCSAAGVKAVVIITAGFKEVGEEGRMLENEILRIAKQGGMRIIGPNCLGLINTTHKLNASFGGNIPEVGSTGYFSQSGALLTAILDSAKACGLGFSKLVSIGNKVDMDELDIMRALGNDPETKVIAGYLESITDGNEFAREAEVISQEKPILLIKSGGTGAGAAAASSHTGSLAGSEKAYECMFARAGIIRCDSVKMQFDYAQAFANQPLPKGTRVAVITNAGGPGIMAADAIERKGLIFATLTDETVKKLGDYLPAAANVHNPIDVLGDALAEPYDFAVAAALADDNVDAILVLLTPQAMTESGKTAKAMVENSKRYPDKPIFGCFMGADKVKEGIDILRKGKIPAFDSAEAAVSTIKAMCDYVRWKQRPKRVVKLYSVNRHKVENIIDRHLRQGLREVGESESKEILEAYGFKTPKGSVATTPEQAVSIAQQIGFPVVMKIWSPDIVHKSDVGGVKIGINNPREVEDAFDLMMYRIPQKAPEAKILGVLVQQMCSKGKEVILGMHRDPDFGPLMMFGMGGTMVEVLQDVAFYLAPLTHDEAKQMLKATRTFKMLQGVRGEAGVDIDSIAEGLQRLSQLVTEFPSIQEMDINPYVVGRPGSIPIAVDARISVEKVIRLK